MSEPKDPQPLLVACQKGKADVVRLMIEDEGYDANSANMIQQSALHVAAWWAHVEVTQVLLEKGANVHAKNSMLGSTPLHCAVMSNKAKASNNVTSSNRRLDCIRLLLEAGSDPQALDISKRTPLDCLDEIDQDKGIITALFNEFHMTQEDPPAIFHTIAKKDFAAFQECLDQGWKELWLDQTPLLYLIYNWTQVLKQEQERQHEMDTPEEDPTVTLQRTGFFEPAINELLGCIQKELKNGGNEGEILSYLTLPVEKDAKGTAQKDKTTITAMDILCEAVFESFRDSPTDWESNIYVQSWKTAIDRLVELGSLVSSSAMLTRAMYSTKPTQEIWFELARRSKYKPLLLAWWGDWKISPLADGDQDGVLRWIANRQGMTPLHFAARSGNTDTVQYLLETVLPFECQLSNGSANPSQQILSLLRQVDDRRHTALQSAQINQRIEIIAFLEEAAAKAEET